jgi:hypothetical protein
VVASPFSTIAGRARADVGILTGVNQVLRYFSKLDVEMLGGSTQYVECLLCGYPLSFHEDPQSLADRLST